MTVKQVGPWIFGVVGAGVLFALGVDRLSWEYLAIVAGVILVGLAITRIRVIRRGGDR
jgi:hypothetical protein